MFYQDNKKLIIGIFFLFFFLSINFVSAQPPFEDITPPSGLAIEVPIFEPIKVGEDFKFHVHVFNNSNGFPLFSGEGNEECNIHLYNFSGGGHTVEAQMGVDSNGIEYDYVIAGGNFSIPGQYAILVWCNNSYQGDFLEFPLYVTHAGEYLGENAKFVPLAQIGILALLFGLARVFDKKKWKIKMFFDLLAVLMAFITLNSIKIIASASSKLNTMGEMGFYIGFVLVGFLFLYLFIYSTIELVSYFKKKKDKKWSINFYAK